MPRLETLSRALPPVARASIALVTLQVVIGALLRTVFWASFRSTAGAASDADWAHAWYLGLKFDLRLALWVCVPFLLLSVAPLFNPVRSRRARRAWLAYFVAAQGVILMVSSVDIGWFSYLGARMDAGVLDLLASPTIGLGMVWQTYPVVRGLLAFAIVLAGYGFLVHRTAFRILLLEREAVPAWRRRVALTLFVVACLLGIYGKWSWYPLRWSDAYFGTDPFVSSLALNPVLYLVDTFGDRRSDYEEAIVREHYAEVARLLDVEEPDLSSLNFSRAVYPEAPAPGALNLVIIHLESFAPYRSSAFGNALETTPSFDAIARDSLLFTRMFVPSGPTARSVFTMVTGIPDLNPLRSASRNPRAVQQHTLINALEGYAKYYFLGGSATWGNIRGLMAHNVEELQIYEEGSFEMARGDVWGISDLDLFEAAHEIFEGQSRPFFALVQTSGNHRPYTIPADSGDFELVELDNETAQINGFENLASLNSMRFLDYSLGRFFELARQADYFEDTVFVLYGDHGLPTPRNTPWNSLGLAGIHVPGVIYAPGLIQEGARIDHVASLTDLLPTSLSLMGVPHLNTTLGRNLLEERPAEAHFAPLWDGLITDDYLLRVDPQGVSRLFLYETDDEPEDVAPLSPDETARLRRLHDALGETARYMMFNNPPRELAGSRPLSGSLDSTRSAGQANDP